MRFVAATMVVLLASVLLLSPAGSRGAVPPPPSGSPAPPPVHPAVNETVLLTAGTVLELTWGYELNFSLAQAATLLGSWNATGLTYVCLQWDEPEACFGLPLLNGSFDRALFPGNFTLLFAPPYGPSTVTITAPLALRDDLTTTTLQAAGNLSIPARTYVSWNFSNPANTTDFGFCSWSSITSGFEWGLFDAAQYRQFAGFPGIFNFSTLEFWSTETGGYWGNVSPPLSNWLCAQPPCSLGIGNRTLVVYDDTPTAALVVFGTPLYLVWPTGPGPYLRSVTLTPGTARLTVGSEVTLSATAVTSTGAIDPAGIDFGWSVGAATSGYLTDNSGANVNFVATAIGNATIVLTATWQGGTLKAIATIGVLAPTPWLVQIESNRSSGNVPLSVNFSAVVVGPSNASEFTWEFGDGSPQEGTSMTSHTYYLPGTYAVHLTAQTASATFATATETIVATAESVPAPPLVVTVSVDAPSNQSGAPVAFSAVAVGGVPPYTWTWSEPPGLCIAPDRSGANCTLPAYGTLVVAVTVSDSDGHSAVAIASASTASPPRTGPPPAPSTTAPSEFPPWGLAVLGVAVGLSILAIGVAVWALLRRGPPPPRSEVRPTPSSDGPDPRGPAPRESGGLDGPDT